MTTANKQMMLKLQHLLTVTCMAVAVFTAASCSDDDDENVSRQEGITTIVASLEGVSTSTRTSITEDKKGVWNKDDAFGVFHATPDGKETKLAMFTCPEADGTAATATFKGVLNAKFSHYAIYPYQDNMSINGQNITMELPKEFTYTTASNGPMYANAAELTKEKNELSFKHLTALLKIKAGSNALKTAKKLIITADKAIAGTCTANLDPEKKDDELILKVAEKPEQSKVVTISLNVTEEGPMTFFVPIPAATYGKLTAKLVDGSGTELYPEKEWENIKVERARMYEETFAYTQIDAAKGNIDEAIKDAIPTGDQPTPVTTDIEIEGAIDASSTPAIAIPVSANSNVNLALTEVPATANAALELKDAGSSTEESPATAVNTVTVSIPKVEDAAAAPNFTITMPKTTVVLAANETEGTTYGKVIAKTAANTLVVSKGVTVNELVVEGGNVRVSGAVKVISKAEALTSPVYLIKEAGASLPESTEGFVVLDATAYDMKAALANGEDYVLTADADITSASIAVPLGKTATLDLNGHTVTASNSTDGTGRITVEGNFTLKDSKGNGQIIASQDYLKNVYGTGIILVIGEDAHMTMESGHIYTIRDNATDKGQFGVGVQEGGNFTMTGGKIESGWYAVSGNGNDKTLNSIIKIEGGELISSADYAVYLPHSGTTTISGGKINGAAGGVAINRGTLNISGNAEILSTDEGDTGDWSDGTSGLNNAALVANAKYGDCTVNITGGTISSLKKAALIDKSSSTANEKNITISGGTFSDFTALEYLADDANVEVKLIKDLDITKPIKLDKANAKVTVQLNNHNITNSTETISGNYGWTQVFCVSNGTLDIYGEGKVVCDASQTEKEDGYRMAVEAKGNGVVNIYGGSYYNTQKKNTQIDLIYARKNGKINIYGGTFESGKYGTPDDDENGRYWVLNILNDDEKTADIKVYGGTFINFNPFAPNMDDKEPYTAEGYEVTRDGEVYESAHKLADGRKEYIVRKKAQ